MTFYEKGKNIIFGKGRNIVFRSKYRLLCLFNWLRVLVDVCAFGVAGPLCRGHKKYMQTKKYIYYLVILSMYI